jgi:hypothetical protein
MQNLHFKKKKVEGKIFGKRKGTRGRGKREQEGNMEWILSKYIHTHI